jgi:hypothetical protein
MKINLSLIRDQRYYGESPVSLRGGSRPVRGGGRSGRQPGEGPTARLFGAPTWVGGVNQDSGKWQGRGPKHRQATDW